MQIPEIDRRIGIETYATRTAGIGGAIKQSIEDFLVQEILIDGSKAQIEKESQRIALKASGTKSPYLLCVLTKRNWDTFIAIKKIAIQLGISQKRIHIAGIKDAKAATAQFISIEHVTKEDIVKIRTKDIEVQPVGYIREELSPFYLLGNEFSIGIRNIELLNSTIEKRVTEVSKEIEAIGGIPNFFGHQRFGTRRPISHHVGKAIIKGNFEDAISLFLTKSSRYEHPSSRSARKELRLSQDFRLAMKNFPKQLRYERLLIHHLMEKKGDYIGAFKKLPPKLQGLFVQAYQSYIFNRFLSERIKKGLPFNKTEVGEILVRIERNGLPMANVTKRTSRENIEEANELVKAGRMRIALPIVGVKQRLSEGEMGEIERKILEEEGVKPDDFKVEEIPEISGRTRLRTIIGPIKDFKIEDTPKYPDDDQERQLKLNFKLLRGSYATIFLQEIMKPANPVISGF